MSYLHPVLPALLLFLFAAAWFNRKRLAFAVTMAVFLWAWPPFAWIFAGTLEWQSRLERLAIGDADAIVVLSGNLLPPNPKGTQPSLAQGTYLRCRYAAWLHKHWRPLPVLASGGRVTLRGEVYSFAQAMAEVLRAEGVPAPLVWTEDQSTNTHENAVYSAGVLRARGIRKVVLVTEAYHMPRAVSCFRKQGLEVLKAPCEFRVTRFQGNWKDFFPSPSMMGSNDDVLHEWVGIFWYRLSGQL